MAGSRREGRILAAQFLYQREVGVTGVGLEEALKEFWELTEAEAKAKEFAEGRIRAVLGKQKEVDAELQKLVTNWEPGRLAPVDRAILRLVWQGETPHAGLILKSATDALMRMMLKSDVPVLHHLVGVKTEAQARARCLGKLNRGREAAQAALRMWKLKADG